MPVRQRLSPNLEATRTENRHRYGSPERTAGRTTTSRSTGTETSRPDAGQGEDVPSKDRPKPSRLETVEKTHLEESGVDDGKRAGDDKEAGKGEEDGVEGKKRKVRT